MPYSGLITHFLGQGAAAARPADPGITPDGISFWWSTDTNEMSAWVEGAWNENVLTALKPTNNLSDLNNIITSRINLGATTIGANLFTLGNPGAIRFIRINADNSISALAAAAFRTAIGAGSGGGDMLAANNLSDVASAATSRTNLGATTIGANLFTLPDPGAISFPRYNADNSVSTLDAASFRAAIGAGSGGGAWALISAQTLAAPAATVSFTAIPATYNDLILVCSVRSTAAATNDVVRCQINGDGAANYDFDRENRFGASSLSANTYLEVAQIAASTAPSDVADSFELTFPNYAGTTFHKMMRGYGEIMSAVGNLFRVTSSGRWRSTTAIDRVDLFVPSTFVTGSTFRLYGRT